MIPYSSSPMMLKVADMKNREDRARAANTQRAHCTSHRRERPAATATSTRPPRRGFLGLVLHPRRSGQGVSLVRGTVTVAVAGLSPAARVRLRGRHIVERWAASNPDKTTTTSSDAKAARHSPVGQCHLLSAKVIAGAVDHSKAVPCSRAHNAETVGVHPLYSKLTKASRNGYLQTCFDDAGNYLGVQTPELDRINALVVAEPGTAKHRVVRCDLTVMRGFSNGNLVGPPVLTRTSLRQQERSGHTATWHWCTNARLRAPSSPVFIERSGGGTFVSCTRPHRAEAEFHAAQMTAVGDRYPTPSTLSRQGHAACQQGLVGRSDADQLQVFGMWVSKSSWIEAGRPSTFPGFCWFYRADGHMLPAVK